jgi:beta-lactamase regulating signal transducer with metallopeptidase domain
MMTMTFEPNAIAQMSALRIVDCLLEGTLIAIFAGAVVRAPRLRNSSAKFAVWFSALMAIAALPALSGAWWWQGSSIAPQNVNRPAITLPGAWALYVLGAWAAVAAWFMLGVVRSLWHLYVLRKNCVPVDLAMLDARLQQTLARNSSARPVTLCTSDRVHVPTAIGLIKPAVILPGWLMQELSADELNQILLHELAHLRRYDDWTNLAQKLVMALFFFHPAVWWIEKQVSLEREMACDDAVLAETASPRAYAECLAHLAEKTLTQRSMLQRSLAERSVALAQAALGRVRQLSLRVAQILDTNRPTGTGKARSWKPAVSLVGAFAIACVLGISRAPRLIAFHNSDVSPSANSEIAAASPSLATATPDEPFFVRPVNAKWVPTPAKATTLATHRKSVVPERTAALKSKSMRAEHDAASMVHLASTNAGSLAFTETFFVVIGSPEPVAFDQPVLQIQLWRVVVFHPVVDPNSNRIPPKQT